MTPEEVAERIVHGVEEEYVHDLLGYITSHLEMLGDPDPDLVYRINRLYDLMPDDLARIYLRHQDRILDEATYLLSEAAYDAGTEQALRDYTGHTPGLMYSYSYQRLHDVTVQGCAEVLNRYNVDLYGNMADQWYQVSMRAISQMATYSRSRDEIIREAVSGMKGVTNITYKSGARYPIDSAVRRHIETQLNQNHQRLTEMRAAEYGWDLFMCSAHTDCRPTHYDFQGRVFSMGEHIGETIDGRKVWDYAELGVGNVQGIYGANCRHYLTPYVPGYSEPQEPPYDERTNEERYDLTQKQRARERRVRADKLEVYAAEQTGDPAAIAQARLRLGREQASLRKFCAENDLVRRYDLERAYGIGKQPRGLTKKAALSRKAPGPYFGPPANQALVNSLMNQVKRHGGEVIIGGEALDHLEDGQEGALLFGVIYLRDNPTASAVVEEWFHFFQKEPEGFDKMDIRELMYRKEIEAKRYLLDHAKQYGFSEIEIRNTEAELAKNEERLREFQAAIAHEG